MKIHSLRWIQKYNSSDASYKHFDFSSDKQRLLKLQHLKDKSVTYNATNDETACICSNFRSLGLHCELSTVLTVVKKKKKKKNVDYLCTVPDCTIKRTGLDYHPTLKNYIYYKKE
jgi:hypothetical protein